MGPNGPADITHLAHPHAVTPPALEPAAPLAKDGQQTQVDAGSLTAMWLMCLAARQPLSPAGEIPKWRNAWLVLEAGDGSAVSIFLAKMIDCGADGEEPPQTSAFCTDWWQLRCAKDGRRRGRKAPAPGADGNDKHSSNKSSEGGAGQGGGVSGDDGGDGATSDATAIEAQQTLSRSVVAAMVGGAIVSKSLAEADNKKVLFQGDLEDMTELTYSDIEDFFNTAGAVLRAQCDSKSSFSWARVRPPAMLCNKWSSPGYPYVVDSTAFVPPNHRSSRGQGVHKTHLAVCVAVHLSPIYANVLDTHFAAARLAGRKKRFRRRDSFED